MSFPIFVGTQQHMDRSGYQHCRLRASILVLNSSSLVLNLPPDVLTNGQNSRMDKMPYFITFEGVQYRTSLFVPGREPVCFGCDKEGGAHAQSVPAPQYGFQVRESLIQLYRSLHLCIGLLFIKMVPAGLLLLRTRFLRFPLHVFPLWPSMLIHQQSLIFVLVQTVVSLFPGLKGCISLDAMVEHLGMYNMTSNIFVEKWQLTLSFRSMFS